MITVAIPTVVALIGALIYALATNAKVAELGRLAFVSGLLAALLLFSSLGTHVLH